MPRSCGGADMGRGRRLCHGGSGLGMLREKKVVGVLSGHFLLVIAHVILGVRRTRQCARRFAMRLTLCLDPIVPQAANDFENFAPGGKLPSTAAFIVVHGFHEFDFIGCVIAFACGGVDLPTTFDFGPPHSLAAFFPHKRRRGFGGRLPTVGTDPAVGGSTLLHNQLGFKINCIHHELFPQSERKTGSHVEYRIDPRNKKTLAIAKN